jgi:hypothetical protein
MQVMSTGTPLLLILEKHLRREASFQCLVASYSSYEVKRQQNRPLEELGNRSEYGAGMWTR